MSAVVSLTQQFTYDYQNFCPSLCTFKIEETDVEKKKYKLGFMLKGITIKEHAGQNPASSQSKDITVFVLFSN